MSLWPASNLTWKKKYLYRCAFELALKRSLVTHDSPRRIEADRIKTRFRDSGFSPLPVNIATSRSGKPMALDGGVVVSVYRSSAHVYLDCILHALPCHARASMW